MDSEDIVRQCDTHLPHTFNGKLCIKQQVRSQHLFDVDIHDDTLSNWSTQKLVVQKPRALATARVSCLFVLPAEYLPALSISVCVFVCVYACMFIILIDTLQGIGMIENLACDTRRQQPQQREERESVPVLRNRIISSI
jgi:hypothetical protein